MHARRGNAGADCMAFPDNADRDAGTQAVISKHSQQGRIAWQSAISNNLLHSAKQFQASNTCLSRSDLFFKICALQLHIHVFCYLCNI